jgi:hypothetical protein
METEKSIIRYEISGVLIIGICQHDFIQVILSAGVYLVASLLVSLSLVCWYLRWTHV